MMDTKKILELAKLNNGVVTSQMVTREGLHRGSLKYLVDRGNLEFASRGVYTLPNVLDDEFVNLQYRYKRGIFSLETALFLLDLTDQTPLKFHMTFPEKYNLTSPRKEGVECNGVSDSLYDLGIVEVKTPGDNKVKSYSAERTLCDILKPKNNTDIQIIVTAFKQYVRKKDKNIPLLSEYSKALKVDEKVRSYLEVLL